MRRQLAHWGSQDRHFFQGTFVRTGYKSYRDHYQPTLLLRDIYDDHHRLITDHLWFNYTLGFLQLGELLVGDQLQFAARVARYEKGAYLTRQTDYKLAWPTQVCVIRQVKGTRQPVPVTDRHALIGYIMMQNAAFYRFHDRLIDDYYVASFRQWLAAPHTTPAPKTAPRRNDGDCS